MSRRCAAICAIIISLLATISWTDAAKTTSSSNPHADLPSAVMVRLPGHTFPALSKATAIEFRDAYGRGVEANQPLTLTVVLKRSDQAGFERYLRDVYDPHSPGFHHFFSQRRLADRFGPTPQTYAQVLNYLRTNGFDLVEGR
jgi:hypothetical protein